jgi:hypothetical protein
VDYHDIGTFKMWARVKVVRPLLTNAKSFGMPYLEDVPSMGMVRKLLTF